VILVYSVLFGTGKILLLQTGEGLIFLVVAGAAAWVISCDLAKQGTGYWA
jgi:hypothetical protein